MKMHKVSDVKYLLGAKNNMSTISSGLCTDYRLTAEQFSSLFTGNIDSNVLTELEIGVRDGNVDCIDMLHNLALRCDDTGKKAEDILFDFFSGKTNGLRGVDELIQKASLMLYKTACQIDAKTNKDMIKYHTPSKILYIAGSVLNDINERLAVTNIFDANYRAQNQAEIMEPQCLWDHDRMLTTDEIYADMKSLEQHYPHLSFNMPMGLINPAGENMISTAIKEKKTHVADIEFFPVNVGEHWMLVALYSGRPAQEETKKCVVFNSIGSMEDNIKRKISDSAEQFGVSSENITFFNGDMQTNVPAGCGLFVIKAMEHLCNSQGKEPTDSVNEFIDNFKQRTAVNQALFNVQMRRQIYAHKLEYYHSVGGQIPGASRVTNESES